MALEFPLNSVPGLLVNYDPPPGEIDPSGNWELVWGLLTVVGFGPLRKGTLRISRELLSDDGARLRVFYDKELTDGYVHRVEGEIICRADRLASPVRWSVDIGSYTDSGVLVAGTGFSTRGVDAPDHVAIEDISGLRNLSISGNRALSWALFDAAQRLPREPFDPIPFTLIDHYDQVKGDQVLSFREIVDIPLGAGGTIPIWGYDQVGWGIIPITYYVDEGGRVLFAISGIEVYVLETSLSVTPTAARFWEKEYS